MWVLVNILVLRVVQVLVPGGVEIAVKALVPAVKVLVRMVVKVIVLVLVLPVVKQVVKIQRSEERRQIKEPVDLTDNMEAVTVAGLTMAEVVVVAPDVTRVVLQLVRVLVIPHVPEHVIRVVVPVV